MRSLTKVSALALTAVLTAGPGWAQATPESIDAVFARWSDRTPGCAVGVEQAGAPPVTRAYGLAELEHGAPATPETIYEAGSVSKQFTAAAILLLAQDGRLSLDDDVRRHVPELPDYGTPITIRHLLTHTSGLRDWGSVAAVEGWPRCSRAMTNDRAVEIIVRQRALNYEPGTEWLYSNSGYNLAAVIVQRVSGESLAAFTARKLFDPLGMRHTRWRDDFTAVVPGRAAAYERRADGYHEAMPFEDAYGNGGLLTTVGDLLIWNRALESRALGEAVTEALHERGRAGGRETHYALGLQYGDHHGEAEIAHGGSTGGYRAWLGRYPERGLSVALLCNTAEANAERLGRTVADLFLPEPPPIQPYVPESTPGGLFVSTRTGEPFGLRPGPAGLSTMQGQPLTPTGPGRWSLGPNTLVFTSADSFDRLTADGDVVPHVRAEPARPDAEALAGLTGLYVNDEAPARIAVAVEDGRPVLRRGSDPIAPLAPAQADVFVGPAGVVRFERDADGAVVAFHLNNGRVRDLVFRRVASEGSRP